MVSNIDTLPKLDIGTVNNILSSIDPDLNFPQQTNFKYYSTTDFTNY